MPVVATLGAPLLLHGTQTAIVTQNQHVKHILALSVNESRLRRTPLLLVQFPASQALIFALRICHSSSVCKASSRPDHTAAMNRWTNSRL